LTRVLTMRGQFVTAIAIFTIASVRCGRKERKLYGVITSYFLGDQAMLVDI
jgi:hypothetical protein